jgi:virulence-associated protein VapD
VPSVAAMSRACTSCQHLKRAEIDRRLAGGEPAAQIARDYELSASSLHRHRTNCLKLASSNDIKKEAARGSAAITLLPSKENLSAAYSDLRIRIDEIVAQAQQQGSLNIAISGLNSIRQTLDSLSRLAGHLQPASTQVNVSVQNNTAVHVTAAAMAERLIESFDKEPELKARIAQALMEDCHDETSTSSCPAA